MYWWSFEERFLSIEVITLNFFPFSKRSAFYFASISFRDTAEAKIFYPTFLPTICVIVFWSIDEGQLKKSYSRPTRYRKI